MNELPPDLYVPDIDPSGELARRLQGKKVLVAGADGFLGLNTAIALSTLGADLTIISRRERPRAAGIDARVLRGDLMDREFAVEAARDQHIVFDLLGFPALSPVDSAFPDKVGLELMPHYNLMSSCASCGMKPIVVLSSSRLVYGTPEYLPVDERHPVRPRSLYAVHKLAVEEYLGLFARLADLPTVIFRIAGAYGPNAKTDPGSYGVLHQFMLRALRREPITIFGDGSQEREYLFIDDAVRAFVETATTPQCYGEVFNLGGDLRISLADAARTIAGQVQGASVRHDPWPPDAKAVETGTYLTDSSKLRNLLELPEQVAFAEGVRRTLEYFARVELDGAKAEAG